MSTMPSSRMLHSCWVNARSCFSSATSRCSIRWLYPSCCYEANLPLPLTFGGINLNAPGLGAIARRSGIIFLRRSFQDNEIYKATFRRYIDYLIEKRFSLLWALEGTRSRTGKLLPPKFGLFNYVFESIMRTRNYDVTFVPVSVVYDQITEVEDYAIEQRGQKKAARDDHLAAAFPEARPVTRPDPPALR